MKNLIIGHTSQISYYLPKYFYRISARDIPQEIYEINWDCVYILFAEQRTIFSNDINYKNLFYDVNVDLTLKIINNIKSKKIIFLSTTELWNLCSGAIDIDTSWNFKQNYYTDSKRIISEKLLDRENCYICYPFNFNSSYRNKNFLFGKIFDSLKNKSKIKIGNINLKRELLHTKYVAESILNINEHAIIGSGDLIDVKQFIIDLYNKCNLNFYELVSYDEEKTINNSFYSKNKTEYTYEKLLKDYIDDVSNTAS